jgi:hypothetical protein
MALTAADFRRPAGQLRADWFVDDLDTLLAAFIAEAEAKSSDEDAQRAWVYHRAYRTLADDRALVAATIAADDIRETFSDSQLRHWADLAARAAAQFDALTGAGGGAVFTSVGFDS